MMFTLLLMPQNVQRVPSEPLKEHNVSLFHVVLNYIIGKLTWGSHAANIWWNYFLWQLCNRARSPQSRCRLQAKYLKYWFPMTWLDDMWLRCSAVKWKASWFPVLNPNLSPVTEKKNGHFCHIPERKQTFVFIFLKIVTSGVWTPLQQKRLGMYGDSKPVYWTIDRQTTSRRITDR